MEHIFFEAQLCSEIAVFKEKYNFWYIYHSTLAPSLHLRASIGHFLGGRDAAPIGEVGAETVAKGKTMVQESAR